MRHKILGIIVVCLALAGTVAPAQETQRYSVTLTTTDGLVIQTNEEEQRLIDAGEATILDSDDMEPPIYRPPSFAPNDDEVVMEEWELMMEQQRQEEEMLRELLADVGITEAELEQFGINLTGVLEPYQQFNFAEPTVDNYVEVCDDFFDNVLFPLISDIRTEAANFFTENQYAKVTSLFYQLAIDYPMAYNMNGIAVGDMFQLFLLPDVVSLTDEQLSELAAMQKEVVTELVGIGVMTQWEYAKLFAEQGRLFEEMENAETEEAKTAAQKKFSEATQKISALMREPMQKAMDKQKSKLDALLTPEQKVRLAQIQADIPDYMKKALGGVTTGDTDESTAAWRPGVNSWMPGMGAPRDREGTNREAPRVREPRGERRFPGSE